MSSSDPIDALVAVWEVTVEAGRQEAEIEVAAPQARLGNGGFGLSMTAVNLQIRQRGSRVPLAREGLCSPASVSSV